jgi:hypothetical protein
VTSVIRYPEYRASPMKCGKNIVVACWANDRQTKAAGSGCLNATVGLTARRFVDFLQTPPSKNCGDREEAQSHNACAKSDNKERKKECKKECHSSE